MLREKVEIFLKLLKQKNVNERMVILKNPSAIVKIQLR